MQSHAEIQKALADCDAEYADKIKQAQVCEGNERKDREVTRAVAFYQSVVNIAGIPCRPVTLKDIRILGENGNAYFTTPKEEADILTHCVHFLWWQFTGHRQNWYAHARFKRRVLRLPRDFVIKCVQDYVSSIWLDKPKHKSTAATESHWSMEASIVDALAQRYGWGPDMILNLPLAQIRQFRNIMHAEKSAEKGDHEAFEIETPKSKFLASEWMGKRNEIAAKLSNTATATV
jgi:hypothetical protein